MNIIKENSFVGFIVALAVCAFAFLILDFTIMGLQGLSLVFQH